MSTHVTIRCDVCDEKITDAKSTNLVIPVVFLTEQNEGRTTKPYLSKVHIDLCIKCQEKMLEGNMLFAKGAMGNNKYMFKDALEKSDTIGEVNTPTKE